MFSRQERSDIGIMPKTKIIIIIFSLKKLSLKFKNVNTFPAAEKSETLYKLQREIPHCWNFERSILKSAQLSIHFVSTRTETVSFFQYMSNYNFTDVTAAMRTIS